MKKLSYLIVIVLISSLAFTGCTLLSNVGQVPTTGQSSITYLTKHTADAPQVIDLLAGQTEKVGEVEVWNDADNLYVKYVITDLDWCLTETHLHVFLDNVGYTDVPQKNGNPPPGQFDYKEEHECVPDYAYEIPLLTWVPDIELFIAAHAVVKKTTVITPAPYYASSVSSYGQGLKKDGVTTVDVERSVPEQGLIFETGSNPSNFFSLGFGGWIIVEFDCPIPNGEGDDLRIIEDTWGTYPVETAEVYASQDGTNWIDLGEADNTVRHIINIHTVTAFDLGSLEWAKYIKIVDTSDPGVHEDAADGYDLNAVESLQDCVEIQEETAWADGFDFPGANWATYFTYTVQQHTLVGNWLLSVNTGAYLHDMFIVTVSPTGDISGEGGYPSSGPPYTPGYDWTLTGSIFGNAVTMTLVYTNGYTATITGTVASDWNSMSGGAGTGGVSNWIATREPQNSIIYSNSKRRGSSLSPFLFQNE